MRRFEETQSPRGPWPTASWSRKWNLSQDGGHHPGARPLQTTPSGCTSLPCPHADRRSSLWGTSAAPCATQTYTAHANGLSKCLPCGVCDPDMGLLTWQECSRWKDTVCRCIPGYFCETQDGEHCSSTCSPHNACAPGQRVQKRGTYSQDTVCAECLTGTFSLGGTQEECLPWTKCGAFQQEVTRGTSSTDTTCSFWVFYSVIFLVLMAIVGIGVFLFLKRRLRHTSPVATELEPFQQEQQENTIRFPVTEVGLAVTEEETASNCTQSG
ncbi:tumor necrosis factor receptor superfamily member 14 isoform X4 [Apodemus sylvaticus]|uniref:tumor necrosis factor receptor superfamily member 14 isoform X4 n=1 Tax=Apodemus sylvaticus TaxID=10129 RepID=UPI002244F1DC|nr:tumor necrosis factor receptor superfamily member 14 isoform X4 [Apodemus sylvaticus]XP_052034297.1 tumor necrosis factor receptor superfamily member 14 isoform X4 [Apodemus sylvaticus]